MFPRGSIMASFKFFNSYEFKDFKIWCENNNRNPDMMLKRLMRLTVILEADLSNEHEITISLNKPIKGY